MKPFSESMSSLGDKMSGDIMSIATALSVRNPLQLVVNRNKI